MLAVLVGLLTTGNENVSVELSESSFLNHPSLVLFVFADRVFLLCANPRVSELLGSVGSQCAPWRSRVVVVVRTDDETSFSSPADDFVELRVLELGELLWLLFLMF